MTAFITPNTREGEKAPAVPFKEDGEFYNYIMYYESDRYIAYADTPGELIEILIPGYEEKTPTEKLDERLAMALRMQAQVQAHVVVNLTEEDRRNLADWEMKCLRGEYNEDAPYQIRDFWKETLPEGMKPEDVPEDEHMDIWASEHPLVLIDVAYAPWTKVLPPLANPEGTNIIWLRPTDEVEFLDSLNSIGMIVFGDKRHAS